jgi:hypothetical protein
MTAREMARLFALGLATPNEGGASAGAAANVADGGDDKSAGDADRAASEKQYADLQHSFDKKDRENRKLRNSRNEAATVLKTVLGVDGDTFEEVLTAAQAAAQARADSNDEGRPTQPATVKKDDNPEVNELKRKLEVVLKERDAEKAEAVRVKAEQKKATLRTAVFETLNRLGIPAEDAPLAASYIRDAEGGNFREDEDGNQIWSPRDLKTGKATDYPFDDESVLQFLPKKFLPAKGGGGSGGGAPRPAGARSKAGDELSAMVSGPQAQELYRQATKGKTEQEIAGLQRRIQAAVTGE